VILLASLLPEEFFFFFFRSHEKAKEVVIYSYNKHINGFAALLEEEEASEIASEKNDLYFCSHIL